MQLGILHLLQRPGIVVAGGNKAHADCHHPIVRRMTVLHQSSNAVDSECSMDGSCALPVHATGRLCHPSAYKSLTLTQVHPYSPHSIHGNNSQRPCIHVGQCRVDTLAPSCRCCGEQEGGIGAAETETVAEHGAERSLRLLSHAHKRTIVPYEVADIVWQGGVWRGEVACARHLAGVERCNGNGRFHRPSRAQQVPQGALA